MHLLKIGFSQITPANLNGSRQNFIGICRPKSNLTCYNFGALGQRGAKWRRKGGCFCNGYNKVALLCNRRDRHEIRE